MTEADKREIISKCRRADRTGLYVMVFIVLMNSCDCETARLRRIEDKLKSIENTITNTPNRRVRVCVAIPWTRLFCVLILWMENE